MGDPNGDSTIELGGTTEVHRSQLRMAERLAARHGHRLRYAHGLGWLVWDGSRWRDDVDGEPYRTAIEIVKEALAEAEYTMDADLDKDARKIETSSALSGVVQIARYLLPVAVAAAELDADPWLFNTTSGTLDLRTGVLRDHDLGDLITKVAGCEYDPTAAGPVFDRFVEEILPDTGVREFVQRLFGYALLGRVTEHVLPILTGVGCNGKTTLVEAVMKAFGDYAIAADPELFIERTWAGHPTGQADLLGVRLAVTQETDEGRRLAAATVKRLTGGDKIRARKMRQDFFQFAPSHTAIMVTNHKPKTSSDDPALWRRIRVVPFDVVVTEIDTALPDNLELELPAILAWCVAGYQAYTELGLDSPVAVVERTEQYRAASDPLGRFLQEATFDSPQAYARARQLFHAWSDWCRGCGEEPGSEVTFSDAMTARGFEKRDRRRPGLGWARTDHRGSGMTELFRGVEGCGGLLVSQRTHERSCLTGETRKPSTTLHSCACKYWTGMAWVQHSPAGSDRMLEILMTSGDSALRADIAEHGIRVPVDVDEDGNILDGHHRQRIADELGIEYPTRLVTDLTRYQKREHAFICGSPRHLCGPRSAKGRNSGPICGHEVAVVSLAALAPGEPSVPH